MLRIKKYRVFQKIFVEETLWDFLQNSNVTLNFNLLKIILFLEVIKEYVTILFYTNVLV